MKTIFCVIGQLGNGGTERQLTLFIKYLDRDRYQPIVVVAGSSDGIWRQRLEELGVEILSLGQGNPIAKMLKFRWLVFKRRPDLVFSWSFFTNAFFSASGGRRFIGSLRQQFSYSKGELSKFRTALCLDIPHIIVNSSFIADELRTSGISDDKISTIFNIVEPLEFDESLSVAELRQQYNIPSDKILIAGVGRDSPSKDFPFYVNVIDELTKTCRDKFHVMLIGSGGTAVQPIIEQKGLSSYFTLTGEVPDARVLLRCADIFFLSSISEGLANVLIEAVLTDCACVATDVGGVRDLLGSDGNAGFVIPTGDLDGAVKSLTKVIESDSLRQQFCQQARNNLNEFTPAKSMEHYYQVLEKEHL